jgi:hypothetical protein
MTPNQDTSIPAMTNLLNPSLWLVAALAVCSVPSVALAQTATTSIEGDSPLRQGALLLGTGVTAAYGNTSDTYGDNSGVSATADVFVGYMLTRALELRLVGLYEYGDWSGGQNDFGGAVQASYYFRLRPFDLRLTATYRYFEEGIGAGAAGATTTNSLGGNVRARYVAPLPMGLRYFVGLGVGGSGSLIRGSPSEDSSQAQGLGQVFTGVGIPLAVGLTLRLEASANCAIGDRFYVAPGAPPAPVGFVSNGFLFDSALVALL